MPEARPRVSEYIPDIVAYIERILDQGFAYSVDGSVYFDTRALECALPPCPLCAARSSLWAEDCDGSDREYNPSDPLGETERRQRDDTHPHCN